MTTPVTLVTGFEPFGGETINPSSQIARSLDGATPMGHHIVGVELPVAARRVPAALQEAVRRYDPAIVLALGQAGGRSSLALERVAINILDFSSPDNDDYVAQDEPIIRDAPAAYFASLPLRPIQTAWQQAGIPGYISNTAGTYICNQVLYHALHLAVGSRLRAGFIHVPYLPQQVATSKRRDAASMSLDLMVQAVRIAIQVALEQQMAIEASPALEPVET